MNILLNSAIHPNLKQRNTLKNDFPIAAVYFIVKPIFEKSAIYGTSMKLGTNEEGINTSDFRYGGILKKSTSGLIQDGGFGH